MSQSSIAVSADGYAWAVMNASPDIREQLAATPELAPRGLRGTPVDAVVLTNGDVDHVAGLLTLREKTAFDLYATTEIHAALAENPIMGVMDPALVQRKAFALGETIEAGGVEIECFAVPGKVPLYKEQGVVETEEVSETTIGLMLVANGKRVVYIPGCAAIPDDLIARIDGADMLLFDGTVWENEEMPKMGAGAKTGRRMGHIPISGEDGSMARLAGFAGARVYIHINNTNPVLQPDAEERLAIEAAGWSIAQDGMEFTI